MRRPVVGCALAALLSMVSAVLAGRAAPAQRTPAFDKPAWSPNGRWIALTDGRHDRILVSDRQTGATLQIAKSPSCGYAFNWSADGRQLGFKLLVEAPDGPPLQMPVVFDVNAKTLVQLHPAAARAGVPSFAADGRIAVTIGEQLQVLDASGRQIAAYPLGAYANLAAIAPDGRSVAFSDAAEQICMLDLASGERRRLTTGDAAYFNPIFSPDSARLLVSTVSGVLKVLELATGNLYRLDSGDNASWADNSTVLYTHTERIDGRVVTATDAYRIRFDGSGRTKLAAGRESARLSPDGKTLAYLDAAAGAVYTAPMQRRIQDATEAAADLLGTPSKLLDAATAVELWPGAKPDQVAPTDSVTTLAAQVTLSRTVPYIHQAYDTPDDFNGDWACNATSAMMCIAYYDVLPYWDVTCSTPYSHVSHYGQYISRIYSYNGYTYNTRARDASNQWAYGGYGYIIGNSGGWNDTWDPLSQYIGNHTISSSVDSSPTWNELVAEINAQHPFVLLNTLTTAGHYIVTIGYFSGQHTAVFNDPWGNKNISYPGYNGAGACYDWPGENNGYQNLNYVQSFEYARASVAAAFTVESRSGGQNFAKYSETPAGGWANSTAKSTASGVTSGIGSRYGSTYRSVAGEKHALFAADLLTAANYEVFATWGSGSGRQPSIRHHVTYAGGSADVNVNQSTTANAWVSLGTFPFVAGTAVGQVDISNLNNDVSGSMYADAVKWEYRSSLTAPIITQQPVDQATACSGTASFSVAAPGQGVLSYQWQFNNADLVEGGHFSGTANPTLVVTTVDSDCAGPYHCVVSNGTTSTTSNDASLTMQAACPADFDVNCRVDDADVTLFLACLAGPGQSPPAGCTAEDLDGDGDVDQIDFGKLQACLSGNTAPNPACAN